MRVLKVNLVLVQIIHIFENVFVLAFISVWRILRPIISLQSQRLARTETFTSLKVPSHWDAPQNGVGLLIHPV